jgi:hypothetical protein
MTMQHFHGVPSWCALIALWTIASPILFSTFTSPTTVLIPRPENEQTARTSRVDEGRGVMGPCGNEQDSRGDEKLILDVHEMF